MTTLQAKRRAVIVGINQYEDNTIVKLEGAENDANEIYERLKDPNSGNFKISDEHYEHFLTGQNATRKNILKAITDVLFVEKEIDLALIYFSGHGFEDGFGEGYIAPYDMIKTQPMVSGIKVTEIQNIISKAVDTKAIVVILDCCYSGLAAKGPPNLDQQISKPEAEGRFIMTSSESDATSREIQYLHKNNNLKHAHGIFTSLMIEGLDGGLGDQNGVSTDARGIVNLATLRKYIEDNMIKNGKQKPTFKEAGGFGIERIEITAAPQHKTKVDQLVNDANELIRQRTIESYCSAARRLEELRKIAPNNQAEEVLKKSISDTLEPFIDKLTIWLDGNKTSIQSEMNTRKMTYPSYAGFFALVEFLYFDKLLQIDELNLCFLGALYDVYVEDQTPTTFIRRCNACKTRLGTSGAASGVR